MSPSTGQLGRFMVRALNPDDHYTQYWAVKATSWFELPQFALALGEAAVSEAAVERSFSRQGMVYTSLRARLSERHCDSQLWLAINYFHVMHPQEADKKAKERTLRTGKKRAQQQRLVDELLAKRQKH